MSKALNSVIHKQAGVRMDSFQRWARREIGCMEGCVPHYYHINPYRRGLNKATGAEPVGLNAVLEHNVIRRMTR